jgi:hypothetical protein
MRQKSDRIILAEKLSSFPKLSGKVEIVHGKKNYETLKMGRSEGKETGYIV